MTRTARVLVITGLVLAAGAATGSCSGQRSFAQLAYDARRVPVPRGVTLVKVERAVNDGPGFTASRFKEVDVSYKTSLPCGTLQQRWIEALRRSKRSFTLNPEPRLYVSSGQVEIVITDRPEHLGITLGSIANNGSYIRCNAPFVWSFNSPS